MYADSMLSRVRLASLAPVFATTVCLAQTTPIFVANHSFEAPAIAAGTFSTTAPPPGWVGYGPLNFGARTIGVLNPATTTLYSGAPPDGANVGVAFLLDNPNNQLFFARQEAGLQQTLGAVLQTSRRYRLTVEVGNIANDVGAPFLFGGFPGYRVELQAGGVAVAADSNTLLPAEGAFLSSVVQVDIGASHPQAGQPLRIRLVNLNAAIGIEVNFDNVRLESEPIATWTNMGFGLGGTNGMPLLAGAGPLTAGSVNQFALSNAAPSAPAVMVIGLAAVFLPILGGTLVPSPDVTLPIATDATGRATLPFTQGAPMPPATRLYAQWWILDGGAPAGLAASNGLVAVSP